MAEKDNNRKGEFYSWTIVNDKTAIKKSDKSFYEHRGSGVPKDIKWFFDAEDMKHG
ncbi:MAG: hypothetical protein HUJ56_00580, partial [Erysipelotrichaceae bacterium]|nr:hypothetical protein [Erysipelotrichaceae bacterium]